MNAAYSTAASPSAFAAYASVTTAWLQKVRLRPKATAAAAAEAAAAARAPASRSKNRRRSSRYRRKQQAAAAPADARFTRQAIRPRGTNVKSWPKCDSSGYPEGCEMPSFAAAVMICPESSKVMVGGSDIRYTANGTAALRTPHTIAKVLALFFISSVGRCRRGAIAPRPRGFRGPSGGHVYL